MKIRTHERPALRPESSQAALEQAGESIYDSYIRVQSKNKRKQANTENGDTAVNARIETSLHGTLTEALNTSVPPGPARALLRMYIERIYGTLGGRGVHSVPSMDMYAQPFYAREALEYFQGIMDAIDHTDPANPEAAADALRDAADAYTRSLTHLTERQIDGIDGILMGHHFPEDT